MRVLRKFVLLSLAGACFAFGQTYTIKTIAGSEHATSGSSVALGAQYGVAVDSRGNIFIALYDHETVVRLDAATDILTVVAGNGTAGYSGDNGPATSAQLHHPEGIAVDSSGNLYIAEYDNACIRKVSNGVITTVAGTGTPGFSGDKWLATSAQLAHPTRVAVDPAGNLYIADSGNYRIRKVYSGVIITVVGNGTNGFSGDNGPATAAQLSPSGIAVDSAGNLFIADGGTRIRKVSSGVITTVVGNGTNGFGGDNGPAIKAELSYPSGLALDSAGNLYIADTVNSRVRKVSNGVITTVAGNGSQGFGGDSGPAVEGTIGRVSDVAVDSTGNLYIADGNQRIRKVSSGVLTTVAGNTSSPSAGFSGDNGPATSAQLSGPAGVAVDQVGTVYIADEYNDRVRRVSDGVITTVAGNGGSRFGGDNGPATKAELSAFSIAVDPVGDLYIADLSNSRVREVSNGVISTVAGSGTRGFGGDNGPAASAQLASPDGVVVDPAGNLYIADTFNQRVRKVSNGVITTVAGNGAQGSSGDNGPAIQAALSYPSGLALDSAGNLYIADSFNHRIRKVSNGVITTVAGNGTQGSSGDSGPAIGAQLNYPFGVAVDSSGNLYIADTDNSRVRKVSNAVITTVAGNGTAGFSGDNGPASSAQVRYPAGVAVDSAGNVYIADQGNNRIRVLTPVTVNSQPPPTVNDHGVVSLVSAQSPLAPGGLASIYGSNFALPGLAFYGLPSADPLNPSGPLSAPTSLGGVTVSMGGRAVPLLFVGPSQINFQVPYDTPNGSANLTVTAGNTSSLPAYFGVFQTAPIILVYGDNWAVAQNQDYSVNAADNPAKVGDFITVYGTAAGAVNPAVPTGQAAPVSPLSTVADVTVTIRGAAAKVTFAGLTPGFVGLLQVNLQVPALPNGTYPIQISVGNYKSNAPTIAVTH